MRKIVFCLILMAFVPLPASAQLTINIRYTGENGSARKYVEEMVNDSFVRGTILKIHHDKGHLSYNSD